MIYMHHEKVKVLTDFLLGSWAEYFQNNLFSLHNDLIFFPWFVSSCKQIGWFRNWFIGSWKEDKSVKEIKMEGQMSNSMLSEKHT